MILLFHGTVGRRKGGGGGRERNKEKGGKGKREWHVRRRCTHRYPRASADLQVVGGAPRWRVVEDSAQGIIEGATALSAHSTSTHRSAKNSPKYAFAKRGRQRKGKKIEVRVRSSLGIIAVFVRSPNRFPRTSSSRGAFSS